MKHLRLMRNIFFGFFAREKRSLTLLVLLALICAWFTLLVGTGALSRRLRSFSSSSTFANVSMVFDQVEPESDAVLNLLQEQPLGELTNALLIDLHEDENGAIVIGWKGTRFTRWHALEADKSFFTEEQVESDELIALRGIGSLDAPAETITLRGETYQVVEEMMLGYYMFVKDLNVEIQSSMPRVIILPWRTFLQRGFHTDVLRLDLARPVQGSAASITSQLGRYFSSGTVVLPPAVEQDSALQESQQRYILLFGCMFLLALFNVVLLFVQLLRREGPDCVVYSFCGGSRGQVLQGLMGSCLLLNALAAALATGLFLAVRPALSRAGMTMSLTAGEGIAVFAGAMLLAALASMVPALRMSRMNARPQGGLR